MKVFVPFSESMVEEVGLGLGALVPFKLEYQCLRVNEAHADEPAPVEQPPLQLDLEEVRAAS